MTGNQEYESASGSAALYSILKRIEREGERKWVNG